MATLKKAKLFLLEPSKAFDAERGTTTESAFVYMLKMLAIVAILSGVLAGISNVWLGLIILATAYIGGLVGYLIGGLWLHIWAYIFGAKRGLEQTLKTVFYGGTPNYLFGWVPYIGILFTIWSLVLDGIGLTRLHGMTGGQAALAVIISILIPLIVMGIIIAALAAVIGVSLLALLGGSLGMITA